jgi:hypothetical protein
MSALKVAVAMAFALCLCGASAMADVAGSRPEASRGHVISGSPRTAAPTTHSSASRAHKVPAIKRTPKRDRSTDLEFQQLG